MGCKSRMSLGLVVALAMALVCNAYLIFLLLWSSGDGQGVVDPPHHESISTRMYHSVDARANTETKENNLVSSLNLTYVRLMINSSKRLGRRRTQALIRTMNKLKLEINPKRTKDPVTLMELVRNWVSPTSLIPSSAPELGDILHFLSTAPIIRAAVPHVGTQLKVMITLDGGYKALLKPQWYERSAVMEGSVYSGADRHNGEIIAFYLSLLLGLRRTPVAVGRRINLSTEIFSKADPDLAATFYKNNHSQVCFYGVCAYCKPELSVCARDGDTIEAAIILWLPASVKLKSHVSPWRRSYKKNVQARWETDNQYCGKLQNESRIYQLPNRRLLDLVDAAVFDFLVSNGDRHHYEVINGSRDAAILLLDNGKSFGRADVDYLDILAPLYQCCLIRRSLFSRLEMMESGPLGSLLGELSSQDALSPLLTDEHFLAVDRRLSIVMQTIELCAKVRSWDDVLVPD